MTAVFLLWEPFESAKILLESKYYPNLFRQID
jgi:hypothetical protein